MTEIIVIWSLACIALFAGAFVLFRYIAQPFWAGLHGAKLPGRKTPRWREARDEFVDAHWVPILAILGLCLAGILVHDFWSRHHDSINGLALGGLLLLLALLDETTWRFWLVVVAAAIWGYCYRRNRQRQEAIIELLLEIRRKLE
jgi:hypothetical protein